MPNKYLSRDDAPFSHQVWGMIDQTMLNTAKSQLTGRKLLHTSGPFGLGFKGISLKDASMEEGISSSPFLPALYIYKTFTLNKRDLAHFEETGIPMDLSNISKTAIECAKIEDDIIFNGKGGNPGLLTVEGSHKLSLSPWVEVGTAVQDIIQAVTTLDNAGFHGPYTLALAPSRFNLLYRRYPQGNGTELEHVKSIVTGGVHKAPVLAEGGILLAEGSQFADILLGQDMFVGFVGPVGEDMEFSISESLAVRILVPGSICVLSSSQ